MNTLANLLCATLPVAAITMNENIFIFVCTSLIALIGYILKRAIDGVNDKLNETSRNQQNTALVIERISGAMEFQQQRIDQWHEDRKDIFDRLRYVEARVGTMKGAKHGTDIG